MANIEMLAWVDINTSLTTQKRLSALGSTLNVFSDVNAFVDDITQNIIQPDSVILIISGSLGQEIIPMIDAFPQLRAIYIYCTDAMKYIHLAQRYDKIGVDRIFSQENELVARLTTDLRNAALVCISLFKYPLLYHDDGLSFLSPIQIDCSTEKYL
jgi:hypothetical protein